MAEYASRPLLNQDGPFPQQLRALATVTQPKTFGSGSGTLERLTPVAYNTSTNKWTVWTNGGANGTGTIRGFVWPDAVELDSSDDVLGNVMLAGRVHYDDIVLPYGETESNLQAALRSGPRELGLTIESLDQVR